MRDITIQEKTDILEKKQNHITNSITIIITLLEPPRPIIFSM